MKIVIDIKAEDFENVKCGRGAVSMMRRAIVHGTLLLEFIEKVFETLREMDDAVDVICNLDVDVVLDQMEVDR
jgi:hypothetical protein